MTWLETGLAPDGGSDGPGRTRLWPIALIWLAVFAALIGAVAAATLVWDQVRHHLVTPDEGSPEAGFARDMAVHHAQAVEMAESIRDRTGNTEVRQLAVEIALTQQAQIGRMRGWLDAWGLPPTGVAPPLTWMGMRVDGSMPGMATREELARLRRLRGEAADALFLRLMIAHHQAGIDMAEAVLSRTLRDPVRDLAKAMAAAQRREIVVMEELLAASDSGGRLADRRRTHRIAQFARGEP